MRFSQIRQTDKKIRNPSETMGARRKKTTSTSKNVKPKFAKRSTSLSVNPKEFMKQCVNHIARKIIIDGFFYIG